MHRHRTLPLAGALFVALAAAFAQAAVAAPLESAAKSAMDMPVPAWLVGTWTLVRCDNVYPDGHRTELYGHDPQGQWMIDAHGHYTMVIARAARTPFAAGDKAKGTPEEYRAASLDINAHYGSMAVQGDKLTSHIVQATFPNWVGRGGTTGFTRDGDQLTYIVAKPSSGAGDGAHGEVVWRKVD